MKKRAALIFLLGIMILLPFRLTLFAQDVPQQPQSGKYWVFFSDKGQLTQEQIETRLNSLEKNATLANLQKRTVNKKSGRLFDKTDLPVYHLYLDSLKSMGLEVRRVSKWLNAASVSGDPSVIDNLPALDFVDSTDYVKTFTRKLPEYNEAPESYQKPQSPYQLDYGPSFDQDQQINVPAVHDQGYTGSGVVIGVFDTGFNTDHPAFMNLDIEATYDFINDDPDVIDAANSTDGQQNHGTSVLSALAGYAPGEIIGPAYGATFCLAKTEIVSTEIQQEEDNFISALEWADSIGCRIVSSSLGYIDWYTQADLNGETAAITIACDMAVEKGMNVIVAAGNYGPGPTSILAPADGFYVIAVGGVLIDDANWTPSSRGPTADGRIKPDICANSSNVYVARFSGGYYRGSGTSFATPLAAGAAALLVESDPTISSFDLISRLQSTARQVGEIAYPNNEYGYGIVDIYAAVGFEPVQFTGEILAYPNPFEGLTNIGVELSGPGVVRGSIHTLDGVQVWKDEVNVSGGRATLTWDGKNEHGEEVANGVYILYVEGPGVETTTKLFKVKRD